MTQMTSSLDTWATLLHTTAVQKGFWDYEEVTPEVVLSKLALVASEVSEVLEAYRKSQGSEKIVEEFADILIRTLDLYEGMREVGLVDHSLDESFKRKAMKNLEREHKHGNLL